MTIPVEQITHQRDQTLEFAKQHLYAFKLAKTVSSILGFIHIVVIGITAITSNILNQTKNPTVEIAIFNNVILYLSASLLAVIKYLDLDTYAQKNLTKRAAYTSLLESLNKKIMDSETIDTDYYLWVTKSYDDLLVSEPGINAVVSGLYYHFEQKKDKVKCEHGINETTVVVNVSENELVSNEAERYEINRYMS